MNTVTLHLFQCKSVSFSSVLNHSWWWWNCCRVWLQTNSWLVKTSSQCWSLQCVQLRSTIDKYICTYVRIGTYVGGIEKRVYVTKPPGHQMVVQSTVSRLLLHTKHCTHSCDMLAQRTVILTLKNQLKENDVGMLQLRSQHCMQYRALACESMIIMCISCAWQMRQVLHNIAQCTIYVLQLSHSFILQKIELLLRHNTTITSKWQNTPLL